ncbi:hypothetical protein ADL12_18905 [Streptomyces regalis]|uniref:Uncharacterized protein n=1 Tax=Streptomyces regalis TaxID=68262 RepID=A0A0X3UWS0_9ACTN|nr:hypothetical protein ADL12_18905 [Streptomyces regalis]
MPYGAFATSRARELGEQACVALVRGLPREVFGQVHVSGCFVEPGESMSSLSVAGVDGELQGLFCAFVVAGGAQQVAEFSLRACVSCVCGELVEVLLGCRVAVLTASFGQLPQGDRVAFGGGLQCQSFCLVGVTGIVPRRDEPSQSPVAGQLVQALSFRFFPSTFPHESHVEQCCAFGRVAQL